MEAYAETLESVGDSIILWADPDGEFSGFTKVKSTMLMGCVVPAFFTENLKTVPFSLLMYRDFPSQTLFLHSTLPLRTFCLWSLGLKL